MDKNPIVFLTKRLWMYSKGNRRNVVFYFVLFLCANIVSLVEPFLVARVLDVIQVQGVTADNLRFILLLSSIFIALQLAFWLFHGPARVIETANAFQVRANYKLYLLNGTLDLPAAWHVDHHSGDTIDKIQKGTDALYEYSSRTFEVVGSALRLLSAFLILIYFDLRAGYVVTFMVVVTVYIILKFDTRLIDQYQQLNRFENATSAKIFDVISNVTTVIILRIERLVAKAIEKNIFQPFKLYVTNSKINEVKWFLVSVCGSIMVFLVLCSYFYGHVRAGLAITIGSVYLLYSYVQRVTDIFFHFAYQYGDLIRQKTAILNAERISQEFRAKKLLSGAQMSSTWKDIRIQSLSFSYHAEDGADLHLDNVSLAIRKGERIALIGESGSGKTTFLKILRGLYQPQSVRIFVDGEELPSGLEGMSQQMALIPQDPEIFSTTIRENITVGVDHSLATIKKYSDMARFTEVALRLPKQWESSIVEKGVNLSGGERQRLALARGLMACADKSIVLLDEPTSSVDLKNEHSIYQQIFRSFKDKTVISSIHRLHLLHLFDSIYFFKDGRIVASGSFEELLAMSPLFQSLWKKYQKTHELSSSENRLLTETSK